MDDSFSELMVRFERDFRSHHRMFETAMEFGIVPSTFLIKRHGESY